MNFNPRAKAIIFIGLTLFYIILFLEVNNFEYEKFKQGELSDNILAIFIIIFLCSIGAFISLAIIDSINNFLKKINLKSPNVDLKDENKSNQKLSKKEKKYNLIRVYWGGVVEGITRLENGEKYNMDTFYNKKHLKYPLREIKDAIIWNAVKYGPKNPDFFQACQTTYMFLANFDTNVRDKQSTGTADMQKIIEKYPNEIIKNDKKQFNKLLKEITSTPKEDKKYSGSRLLELKMKYGAEFSAVIKKLIAMASNDLKKTK
tara:strand:+ start:150 stop:929 length:780 start_codon:yes stop_codon:yes gene_type:complete